MKLSAISDDQSISLTGKVGAVLRGVRLFMGRPLARWLVLGLFALQAVVLVFVTHIGTPPDELNHISFIEYYAQNSVSPIFSNQQPTYNLGDKTHEVDYWYHYIMSWLYRGLPISAHGKYMVIRLCSVVLALLAFLVLANVFRRLGLSAATITIGLLIITNLPMVLMMSSAVNNDVTVWLGAALGLLLLLRLWEKPRLTDLLWLGVLSIAGGMFKRTLLPLGLIYIILGMIVLVRHFRHILAQFKPFRWHVLVVVILLVISLGLFTERVGGNLIHYHTPTPSCDQVQGVEACSVFWGDIRASGLASQPPEKPVPVYVFPFRWLGTSLNNVVNIQTQSWRHQVNPARWVTPLLSFFLISGIGYGLYYDRRKNRSDTDKSAADASRRRLYIMWIGLYFMIVHMIVNYSDYRQIKFFGIALNGRYIIPSLLPLIIFACFYWSKLLARRPRLLMVVTAVVIIGTIFGSGLILMLRNPQLLHG